MIVAIKDLMTTSIVLHPNKSTAATVVSGLLLLYPKALQALIFETCLLGAVLCNLNESWAANMTYACF